eukprot:2503924-Pyramimonas_sp.AAC.1
MEDDDDDDYDHDAEEEEEEEDAGNSERHTYQENDMHIWGAPRRVILGGTSSVRSSAGVTA